MGRKFCIMIVQMPPSFEQLSLLVKVFSSLNPDNNQQIVHIYSTFFFLNDSHFPSNRASAIRLHFIPLTYLPTSLPPLLLGLVMSLERRNVSSHEPETQMCEIHFDIVRPHQKHLQSQLEGFFKVDCCKVLHLLQFRILQKNKTNGNELSLSS